jgi:hypothetical protein
MEVGMKGVPTQKKGNVARQNKNGTRDRSGDGADLPKYRPPKKK